MQNVGQQLGSIKMALLALAIGAGTWGCGGGSGTTTPTGGSSIKVTFVGGTPTAVASQVGGTGAFTPMTPASTVTIPVPSGSAKYAIAYLCAESNSNFVTVIEATTQDISSFTTTCGAPPTLGAASGSASSSITNTADIQIVGGQGDASDTGSASGSFSVNMPVGTNDVAAIAVDSSHNVLGVKIVRSQTIPGTVNGGAPIALGASDQTSPQSLTVTNIPSGFSNPPDISVTYNTANGTPFLLNFPSTATNPGTYQAVPTAATQSGDFYEYQIASGNGHSSVGITTTTASGGGAVTLSLPVPWTFSGPAPATFPTFTYVYTGFTGQAAVADDVLLRWVTGATSENFIEVMATANFQGGSTTITIPVLSAVNGFFGPAPSGTTIDWFADIYGGTAQELTFFSPTPPPNATVMSVRNTGTFVQP